MHSPGEVVPGSRDAGSGGLHRLPGGEVWIVTCARTQVSWWGSSSLSVSCPSLGSALIAAAHVRLWGLFRGCSESPLLTHQETKRQEKVSCLFGSSRPFPGLPPGQLWCTNPFRLCSRRQPLSSPCDPTEARASAPSSLLPQGVSRQAAAAGECGSVLILCAGISLLCPLHPCGCAFLRGSEASPLCHPQSLPAKGLPSVWRPFLLHSSLPLVQVPSLFFCPFVSFFFCPTQVRGEFLAFWEV